MTYAEYDFMLDVLNAHILQNTYGVNPQATKNQLIKLLGASENAFNTSQLGDIFALYYEKSSEWWQCDRSNEQIAYHMWFAKDKQISEILSIVSTDLKIQVGVKFFDLDEALIKILAFKENQEVTK